MNLPHGQIDPKHIFTVIDKYKLFPVQSIIHTLRDRPNRDRTPACKNDSYQLGVTLLRASNLGDPRPTIEECVNEAAKLYSTAWIRFLKDLLKEDHIHRPDCLSLYRGSQIGKGEEEGELPLGGDAPQDYGMKNPEQDIYGGQATQDRATIPDYAP